MTDSGREPIPLWARLFLGFADKTIWNAPGKPRIKVAWAVDFHKIFTLFIIYGMMHFYNNFTTTAWVFLGLHGIYGYCWLIKDFGFRDHTLNEKMSLLGAVNMYLILVAWYWLLPWFTISQFLEPSGATIFAAIAVHTLGVVTMIAADGQRHWVLKYRQTSGLITDGVYRYTRNPNYLGELMLYSAYAILANHWIGWLIYGYMTVYFLARMKNKDYNISRHANWQAYKSNTGLVIPWALFNGRAIIENLGNKEKK